MINRHEFAEEVKLREHVRRAIKVIKSRRGDRRLKELSNETALRSVVRSILKEGQSGVADSARHDSTGINALEDLLKNSNILSVLEKGYKSLTTRSENDPPTGQTAQRKSYADHILVAIEKSLAPEESRKKAGEDSELDSLEEDLTIDIDRPEDDPDFIDVEEKEEVVEEPDERDTFGISGADKTGRNMAYTDFQAIEKVILSAFDDLDNTEDSTMFEEFLVKNLALYFDKFESELDPSVEEPAAAASAELDADVASDEGELDAGLEGDLEGDLELGAEEEETANIELQEIAKYLNIDDIIENLL
tara:strand:- start:213 stop:1127 length:915 start_codon:yes stop_codon:yes gene_type:complete